MYPELERAWATLRRHEAALEHDPESVPDLVGIALLLSGPPIVYSGAGTLRGAEAYPRAIAAARRVLTIAPDVGDAHGVLGFVAHNWDWDFAAADDQLARAVQLGCAPRFAYERALLLAQQGRDDEAMAALAMVSDPATGRMAAGAVHYLAGRFGDAQVAWEAPFWQALALCALGEPRRAVDVLAPAVGAIDRNPGFIALLAYAHVLAGDDGTAESLEQELYARERAGERIVYYQMATVEVARGNHDRALEMLEGCLPGRGNWLPWLPRDVRFAPLRPHPRFQSIIAAVGIG